MYRTALLETILLADPLRRQALEIVASCGLSDCWIGAGFVRDAVWEYLHGYPKTPPRGDVDVVWFAGHQSHEDDDLSIEQWLCRELPELQWSVKNQARMHMRNGDEPYTSVADAMRHWPETATAVAVRLEPCGSIKANAPFGLDDLFALKLRPTPAFLASKFPIFEDRVLSKRWIDRYPRLSLEASAPSVEQLRLLPHD